MLCAPMVAVLLVSQRRFEAHTYRQLIPQLLAGGLVYGLGLGWAYKPNRAPAIENYEDV
jgi:hypothetical protein